MKNYLWCLAALLLFVVVFGLMRGCDMLIIAGIVAFSFVWVVWQMTHAKPGWEDELGFHEGERR